MELILLLLVVTVVFLYGMLYETRRELIKLQRSLIDSNNSHVEMAKNVTEFMQITNGAMRKMSERIALQQGAPRK